MQKGAKKQAILLRQLLLALGNWTELLMNINEPLIVNMFRDAPWPGNVLSNFADTPFEIDGIECVCSEAFIQSLKCSDVRDQQEFCSLAGQDAWSKGSKLSEQVFYSAKVWWRGEPYNLHSSEHFALVKRGLYAKYTQSALARNALIASGNATLTHDYGQTSGKKQSLPVDVFCQIVTEIRSEVRCQKNA